jgi:glucosyl-3-phosphoglycerate phosphatase
LQSPVFAQNTRDMTLQGRIFIARHGETVFNAAKRMQGDRLDTPLTRTGFAQADAMGKGLADWLGTNQSLHLWSSPSGRALQTLAIVCEHIRADWHGAYQDPRLQEINVGDWAGRTYADIMAEQGDILDPHAALFTVRPPGGEWFDDVAARLQSWIDETSDVRGDRLVIMHGMSARVLRGILLGLDPDPRWNAPVAPTLPQGTMVMIGNGTEKIIHLGQTIAA